MWVCVYIIYVMISLVAVRSRFQQVKSESKRPRCRRLKPRLVPIVTGWRRDPAKHLNTVQYSNRIWSHWIFVFDSIFDSYSKFQGYSIQYLIQMKLQIRPILSYNTTLKPNVPRLLTNEQPCMWYSSSNNTYCCVS